jgi:ribonucleoside-diphosphate reductase beta chain
MAAMMDSVSPLLVRYERFLDIAAGIQWDAGAIDLAGDAAAWPGIDAALRERVASFVAAFRLAEERVAVDLDPFVSAAPSPALAACFRAQARDEERHARFFERYEREVLGDVAPVDPEFAELFEERLGAAARALAAGDLPLADAVALYHLVLEGVVFSAGQTALLAELEAAGELPGLREGLERVVADERWHIGLGVRVLRGEAGAAPEIDGERAIEAWGDLLSAPRREATLVLHRRRLAAAGLSG